MVSYKCSIWFYSPSKGLSHDNRLGSLIRSHKKILKKRHKYDRLFSATVYACQVSCVLLNGTILLQFVKGSRNHVLFLLQ